LFVSNDSGSTMKRRGCGPPNNTTRTPCGTALIDTRKGSLQPRQMLSSSSVDQGASFPGNHMPPAPPRKPSTEPEGHNSVQQSNVHRARAIRTQRQYQSAVPTDRRGIVRKHAVSDFDDVVFAWRQAFTVELTKLESAQASLVALQQHVVNVMPSIATIYDTSTKQLSTKRDWQAATWQPAYPCERRPPRPALRQANPCESESDDLKSFAPKKQKKAEKK
jgi:hypothetical protein